MRNYIYALAFFISFLSVYGLAQEKNEGVELPDFVITGVERVTIKNADKAKTDPVSSVSGDYINPVYSLRELPVADLSNPIKKDITLKSDSRLPEGTLILGAGIYTMPTGTFAYNTNSENFLFGGVLWGSKEMKYEDYSDRNNSGIKLYSSFFAPADSGFFHGMQLDFGARYYRDSYKYFASVNPKVQRDYHEGNLKFGFRNILDNSFNYSVSVNDDIFYLKDTDIKENLFGVSGSFNAALSDIEIKYDISYKNQITDKRMINGSKEGSFVNTRAIVGFSLSEDLKVSGGLMYASSDSENIFAPVAMVSYKMSKYLAFYGSIISDAEFLSIRDMVLNNPYYMPAAGNLFYKCKNKIEASAKYEFETYYEVQAGMKYARLEDYFYFSDAANAGCFDINRTNATQVSVYASLLFHPGPMGRFYGNVNLTRVENDDDKILPYNSVLNGDLRYFYDFQMGLSTEFNLVFHSKAYSDIDNNISLPFYINAGVTLKYEIIQDFKIFSSFDNLLNRNNYMWKGYNEKPLDIVAGIEYMW